MLSFVVCATAPLRGQMPFYTDNADVTDNRTLHIELFNEFDGLRSAQFPDLRQNTFNYKINYGLPHRLELDFDAPYFHLPRAGTAIVQRARRHRYGD